jgi:hypothetical protein
MQKHLNTPKLNNQSQQAALRTSWFNDIVEEEKVEED